MEVVGLAGIDLVQPLLLKQMSKFVTFEALCAYTYYIYIYQPSLEGRPSELHNEKPESVNNRNQGWKRLYGDLVISW